MLVEGQVIVHVMFKACEKSHWNQQANVDTINK